MNYWFSDGAAIFWGVCLFLGFSADASGENASPDPELLGNGATALLRISGKFEVELIPQEVPPSSGGASIDRMSLDKKFFGALDATSQGQMLAAKTSTPGSAGYVAMEIVKGKLEGRSGTFVLQHSATIARGVPRQAITVVPDSGTAQLEGLVGEMKIEVSGGEHLYHFEYRLPAVPPS